MSERVSNLHTMKDYAQSNMATRQRVATSQHIEPISRFQAMDACWLVLHLDSESDEDNIATLVNLLPKPRIKSKESKYLRDRSTQGEFKLSENIPESIFRKSFRLGRDQFNEIHELIKDEIAGGECNARKPIETKEKLSVCLRYFATGDMFKTIALNYRMGERTVSKIVSEVSKAIWRCLQPVYMPTPTANMWEKIASDFENKLQIYNCVGSIDAKHVCIRKPPHSCSTYNNCKEHSSVVLMTTSDAHYRFTTIELGCMGRLDDENIFDNSNLSDHLKSGYLQLPKPKMLPGQTEVTPYVFVGDPTFPLLPNILRPYPHVIDNTGSQIYNQKIRQVYEIVEYSLNILANRFHIYKKPFECKLETVDDVVKATAVLHNYMITKVLTGATTKEEDEELINTTADNNFTPLPRNQTRYTKEAFDVRENFKEYFNSQQGLIDCEETSVKEEIY